MTDETKKMPEFFTSEDGVICFRPVGDATLDQAADLIDGALKHCRDNGIRGVLVSTLDLNGITVPSTADRYFLVSRWAATAGGQVAMSMLVQDELLDPDRIGITMASNRGLVANATSDEAEALAWIKNAVASTPRDSRHEELVL